MPEFHLLFNVKLFLPSLLVSIKQQLGYMLKIGPYIVKSDYCTVEAPIQNTQYDTLTPSHCIFLLINFYVEIKAHNIVESHQLLVLIAISTKIDLVTC